MAALSNTKYSEDKRDCVYIAKPKIHQSVFERIAVDAHLYAPVSLPSSYEVLTYDERVVSPDELRKETPDAAHRFPGCRREIRFVFPAAQCFHAPPNAKLRRA